MTRRGNFRGNRGGFGRGKRGNRGNHHNRSNGNRGNRQNHHSENTCLHKPEQLAETEVGITEFISSMEGFSGVIKGRYSDFHVNEIDLDGNVAKLTDTRMPKEFEIVKVEPPVESPLKEISEEKWKEINDMMTNTDDNVIVELDCLQDKDTRSLIHKTLKHIFQNKIISNTIEEGEKKCIQLKRSIGKNKQSRNNEWPTQVPIYTHFLLYKESVDTMNAIMSISDTIHINSSAFNYAGVKDRRAKTTQWISCKKVEPAKLLFRCKRLRNIKLGNITFKDTPLKLGNLKGNLFRVALRDITVEDDVLDKHLQHLKEHGFINYYGMQRFGNDKTVPTHLIGIKLLQGNFREACNLILKPKHYDNPLHEITQAKRIYEETENAVEASKKLSSNQSIESKLIFGLAKSGKNDFVTALECIPRNMRLMYIHSFQSYIWNLAVSKRVKDFGMKPVVGDLVYVNEVDETEVLLDDVKGIKETDDTELKASEVEESLTQDNSTEETTEFVEIDRKLDVKIIREDDLDNYTIYDVVLPLPGYNVTYPENSLKDYYKELLEKHNLELDMPMQRVKCYTLSGNYRKILGMPKELIWHTIRYNEPKDVLIRSDFEEILNHTTPINQPDGKFKGLVVTFKLKSSSYATMVLREVLKIDTSQNPFKLTGPLDRAKIAEEKTAEAEGSLLNDKNKFEAFKKLVEEETAEDECVPHKRAINEEDVSNKRQKLDDENNEEDEGIKIQPSLI